MNYLLKKLNFKGQTHIHLFGAPEVWLEKFIASEFGEKIIRTPRQTSGDVFILTFVLRQMDVDFWAKWAQENTTGDAIIWVAYPKNSSKKYHCDFNRDTGWEVFGEMGFEPVRQVALDEDWSALRFRRVEFIAKMTRSFAMTEEGKVKSGTDKNMGFQKMPADFSQKLQENDAANTFFEQLAPSHRKEYLRWIAEAKRPETRQRRIEKAILMLLAGKKGV